MIPSYIIYLWIARKKVKLFCWHCKKVLLFKKDGDRNGLNIKKEIEMYQIRVKLNFSTEVFNTDDWFQFTEWREYLKASEVEYVSVIQRYY